MRQSNGTHELGKSGYMQRLLTWAILIPQESPAQCVKQIRIDGTYTKVKKRNNIKDGLWLGKVMCWTTIAVCF